jgi:5-methylcytosine-specific restriction protein B
VSASEIVEGSEAPVEEYGRWSPLLRPVAETLAQEGPKPVTALRARAVASQSGEARPARGDWNADLATLLRAGWILKDGDSVCAVTSLGVAALGEHGDAERFARAAGARATEWQARRHALLNQALPAFEPAVVASEILPDEIRMQVVRQASPLFVGALRDGGSVLTPGAAIWVPDVLEELEERMGRFDGGPDTFWVKLTGQMKGAGAPVQQALAELLCLIALPLGDLLPDRKRMWVAHPLVRVPGPPPLPLELDLALEGRAFNGGLAFRTQLWRTVRVVAGIMHAASRLPATDRDTLTRDPWAWRDLVDQHRAGGLAAGNSLKFMVHPGTFLPIVSDQDKRTIVRVFLEGETSGDLDRDLHGLTLRLQTEAGGPMDYYEDPYWSRWHEVDPAATVQHAWLVRGSAVQGSNLVPLWLADGIVSLPASQLTAIPDPTDGATLRAAINAGYQHLSAGERKDLVETYLAFLTAMSPGDVVVTIAGEEIHIGDVADGDPELMDVAGPSRLRRPVTWRTPPEGVPMASVPASLAARLRTQKDVADLTDVLDVIVELVGQDAEGDGAVDAEPAELELAAVTDELAGRLFTDRTWLQQVVDLLEQKRQVILYGPPGTGKTFLALALAEHVAPDTHTLVQFHPTTSYEDFFEGLRPVLDETQLLYEMKRGPLRRLVDDARKNPIVPYILVIDEINRANLPKVFGELYFLLEYRDRGIELLYSPGEQFVLPPNVFLIGTMNTADRSIALVDNAMRRRFAFVELHPDREPTRSVLPRWCAAQGDDLPARLLAALNEDIADRELRLGPSYFMDKRIGEPGVLERIWRTQVLPLLVENEVGVRDVTEVESRYALDGYLARIPAGGPADGSPARTPPDGEVPGPDPAPNGSV